ncbi:MAG: fumarylacetoacetate hydrolase family protein [Saprospiraceae bacterium]
MRLVRYGNKGREKPGIEIEGIRFDCSKIFKDWDREFFQNDGLNKLKNALEKANLHQVREIERVAPPISRPGMIICVGLNFSDHAKESGTAVPKEPILFIKASNTIAGAYDKVPLPLGAEKVDWEVELGIVIGQDIYNLDTEEEAEEAIAGYTIVHDVSERAFQFERGGQWVKGKSCPGFSPTGPCMVTKDEVNDVLNLKMELKVNDEIKQNSSTKLMIFKPVEIVKYISKFMKLEAGDLISTGTPKGVALGMENPKYLKKGDIVDLTIEGLGQQTQVFV